MEDNFIFLTNQYLPKPGATGLCVHQLAKNIAKDNNVWTVCYEDEDDRKIFDHVNIIKIKVPFFLRENNNKSNIARKIQYFGSLISKAVYFGQYPLRSRKLIKNYKKAIESIINSVGNATIVASYTPLEAVIAAKEIKEFHKDNVKIVYYSTDTLSNEKGDDGILSAEYRTAAGLRWEKKLFNEFDKICIMECHKEHYYSSVFSEYKSKYAIVNFPLFTKLDCKYATLDNKNQKIRFVYAGTLYQKLRNPEFLINVLMQLSNRIDMESFFLGGGDCESIMHKAELESNGAIRYIGMQPHNVAVEYLSSADILLSIGNVESPMAPSKIYEYMSTGKPIIHTYTYENDPCIEPLKQYGNALLIKENECSNITKVAEFVLNRKKMEYAEVENKFITSTPKYTVDIIREV